MMGAISGVSIDSFLAPITWLLILIVAWFLRKTLSDLEDDISEVKKSSSEINSLSKTLVSIKAQFGTMRRDVETALIAAKQVDILKEKLAVHQRNEQTMWEHIDKLKTDLLETQKDFQRFGGLIAELRRHIIREAKDGSN